MLKLHGWLAGYVAGGELPCRGFESGQSLTCYYTTSQKEQFVASYLAILSI